MSTEAEVTTPQANVERGTYEIIRDRLLQHGRTLGERAEALNARRVELFGSTELTVVGSERVRTDNNCIPRDIVSVGGRLLFGYNVFIGLKTETAVADVFSLYDFAHTESGFSLGPLGLDAVGGFLADPQFVKEFKEVYQYYKEAKLIHLRRVEGKLLAVFQIGASLTDVKVFRWATGVDGSVTYLDNRGERDNVFPPSHDFEWSQTSRDNFVVGRHPHVSILDQVFVDTVQGDLTIKIENNTEDGLGIYREPVEEQNQSLEDAQIWYAKLGGLVLLKILPYRESSWRYFVFNTRTQRVNRIDAIGQACVQLPEDHGLIYPGGYYLQNGETKTFEANINGMEFERVVRSPNGEDVLYAFYQHDEGLSVLLPYNMIRKQVQNPITCHGYSIFDDGTMLVFRAQEEPTRVHTMQIWQTPFTSDDFAANAPSTGTFLESIGNAELVRGISDCLSLRRGIENQTPSVRAYEDLIRTATRLSDSYHWLASAEVGDLAAPVAEIRATAELIIDEFEKVESLRAQARNVVDEAARTLDEICRGIDPEDWTTLDLFVAAMGQLRTHRGHIITLRDVRYVDRARLDALEEQTVARYDELGEQTVGFLLSDSALQPYVERLAGLDERIAAVERVTDCAAISEDLESVGGQLELLTDVVGNLKIDDATVRTRILESISEVLASLNRSRAVLANRRKELLSREGVAEFGARFRLLDQNMSSALGLADTPEKCEEQLSKVMLQLEELESRFSEFDEFLVQLATKREEIYEAFNAKRQALLDERQRRAENTAQAADRILQGITRRAQSFETDAELNAFFASDAMVMKLRELADRLRGLGDSVRADEVESRLKASRSDAARGLRDRRDIFEDGASVIKLGRHRFSVNTQQVDLTLVPRDGEMYLHLTGTDFYQRLDDPEFEATRPFWPQQLVSETDDVARAEYLAACILADAEEQRDGLSIDGLVSAAIDRASLLALVRAYAQTRYDEGYERGIHDADAAAILEKLVGLYRMAGVLRFSPVARAHACLFWAYFDDSDARASWERRARSLDRLRTAFAHSPAISEFTAELGAAITEFQKAKRITVHPDDARAAGAYLFEELVREPQKFAVSAEASALRDAFVDELDGAGTLRAFADDMRELDGDLRHRFGLAFAWLDAFVSKLAEPNRTELRPALEEAAVLIVTEGKLSRTTSSALSVAEVDGLLAQHPRVRDSKLRLRLDEFLSRLGAFRHTRVPAFREYQARRHALLERERKRLRLSELQPKVMSSFVRNRLINEVYLPLIGDNLAKQIGALGEGKRTDLMGMLLLISPPGYGKTTLMEYVANRLGLVFVKVNGPALGHSVVSLDPGEAPNATARQEVQKINLALEMGNNVLLYLDDIQHTNPELLQKFISLCDAQRKIEGVWNGETRTYDLRGKRFCVCMAGNPYTESGEQFKIPDMLANRADTYNLGDILEGKEELFALSYIENALTSNAVLAPLTTRAPEDLYLLVRMARGEEIELDKLSYEYSAVELGEIRAVLDKLTRVQRVLLKVNQQYILSASQAEAFRTEPPFKLQGSYRNMNKLAEKILPVLNDQELEALVDDHYAGEAQTLTTGAEQNLLKLAELRGRLTPDRAARWDEIKKTYGRIKMAGGADDDPVTRLTGHLAMLSERVEGVGATIERSFAEAAQQAPAEAPQPAEAQAVALLARQFGAVAHRIENLGEVIRSLASEPAVSGAQPQVTQAPVPQMAPAAPAQVDLTPYLGKLDETLAALAAAPRGGEVVQVLPTGVTELIEQMIGSIEESLMPAVRSLEHEVRASEPATDPKMTYLLDRTLKNLDLLKDLFEALRKIDTRGISAPKRTSRKPARG